MEDTLTESSSPVGAEGRSETPHDEFELQGLETDEDTIAGVLLDDILLDRGMRYVKRPANARFRGIIESSREEYFETDSPSKKSAVIDRLVENIGGRFLRRNKDETGWFVIAKSDVRQKIAQTLQYQQRLATKRSNRESKVKKCTSSATQTPQKVRAKPVTISEVSPITQHEAREIKEMQAALEIIDSDTTDDDTSWPLPFHPSPPYEVWRDVKRASKLHKRAFKSGLEPASVPEEYGTFAHPKGKHGNGCSLLDMWYGANNNLYWQTLAALAAQQAQTTSTPAFVGQGMYGWDCSVDQLHLAATKRSIMDESEGYPEHNACLNSIESTQASARAASLSPISFHVTDNGSLGLEGEQESGDVRHTSPYEERRREHPCEARQEYSGFDFDAETNGTGSEVETSKRCAVGVSSFGAVGMASTCPSLPADNMDHCSRYTTVDFMDEPIPLNA